MEALFIFFIAMDSCCDGSMNHREMENALALEDAFREADFQVSRVCCSRPSCFDFAARKENKAVLIKIHPEVDTFSPQDSRELRVIAGCLSAASLVVSQRTHDKPLEDDTVYSRYAVFVVTEKTIQNLALQTAYPLIHAGPGGYSVEIDGELVEKRRKEMGLSIGKLAEMVGVSRRTLYGYERSMAKASVASAYNLAKTLGVPVANPINVLGRTKKQRQCLLRKAGQAVAEYVILQKIFRKFAFCEIYPVRKAPFDFVMNIPTENLVIAGIVAVGGEAHLDERIEEILSVCRVIHAYPVLITEKIRLASKDISCVRTDEVLSVRTLKELIASF
jgi:putative transcriptional regulator